MADWITLPVLLNILLLAFAGHGDIINDSEY